MSSPSLSPVSQETSIIIVDDAKFTLEMLRRVLRQTGYSDIRIATTAERALEMVHERMASILLADWLMPEMDGLTLTRQVRQIDEENNHYTYIILLTAREGLDSLAQAFEEGVDDFINKSPDNKELLARINAASRIAHLQNDLLKANRRLRELNRQTDERNSFDLVTGLGNRIYLERQIAALLRHVDARGGGACLCVIRINDYDDFRHMHGDQVTGEVLETAAKRLQQTVRPLDVVARVSESEFGILMHQERADYCHPNAFRRIHQALNLRAFKTSGGFLSVISAITICGLDRQAASVEPNPTGIVEHLRNHLDDAAKSGLVHMAPWPGQSDGK
ncbi:MAG: response regulator [Aquisalimonadaceae bacterium]